jgi:hypothetical protein
VDVTVYGSLLVPLPVRTGSETSFSSSPSTATVPYVRTPPFSKTANVGPASSNQKMSLSPEPSRLACRLAFSPTPNSSGDPVTLTIVAPSQVSS